MSPFRLLLCFVFSFFVPLLFGAAQDARLRIEEVSKIPFAADKPNHTSTMAFTPDGKLLIAQVDLKTVRAWETTTGKERWSYKSESLVWDLAVSPDGKIGVGVEYQGAMRCFDAATGEVFYTRKGTPNIRKLRFDAESKKLLIADNYSLQHFDIVTAEPSLEYSKLDKWLFDEFRDEQMIAIRPGLKQVATTRGFNSQYVKLWDIATKKPVHQIATTDEKGVMNARFSPCGKYLVVYWGIQGTRIWNVEKGTELKFLDYNQRVDSIAISADSRWLATTPSPPVRQKAGEIVIWDLQSAKRLTQLDQPARCLAFSPKGNMLAAKCEDSIRIWTINESPKAK